MTTIQSKILDFRQSWQGWSLSSQGDFGAQAAELFGLGDTWPGLLFLLVVVMALFLGAPPLAVVAFDAAFKTDPSAFLWSVCKGGGYFLALSAWSLLIVAYGMRDKQNIGLLFWLMVVVGLAVGYFVADGSLPLLLILLILGALQIVVPLAVGDSRKENAEHDLPKFAMFTMMFLGSWLMLTMPVQALRFTVPTAPVVVQNAVPVMSQTTVPVIAPTSKPEVPKAQTTPTSATKPFPPAGTVLTAAAGQYLWFEQPTGSGKFVEFKVNVGMFTGKEKLNGVCKVAGGDTFCQTDKTYSGNQTWWKVK